MPHTCRSVVSPPLNRPTSANLTTLLAIGMWGPGVARQSAAMWSMELPPAYGSLGRFPAYSDSQDRINECLCLPELLVYWYNDTGSYHLSVFYAPVRVCVHDFY